ncbi:MAG: hypothetical protein ABI239_11240 [Aquihabitans sp.]
MSFAEAAFISLARMESPEHHQAYNEWHQLDHRPENLVLDGVMWGERWVQTPELRAASLVADGEFGDFHYLTLYWFRPPVEVSISAWTDLADRSFHWGRRQELAWTERPFMGFFRPILGYAAPRVDVSPQALPFRPNRGVYVVASKVTNAADARAVVERRNRWYDREGLPTLLKQPGVAGGWTFTAEESLTPSAWAQKEQRQGIPIDATTNLRLTVLFLDDDPLEVAAGLSVEDLVAPDGDGVEHLRFAGPLEAIEPWKYDWFANSTSADGVDDQP